MYTRAYWPTAGYAPGSRTELRYKLIVFRQYRNTSRINFKIITEFWQDIGILIKPEWISKLEEKKII